MKNDGRVVVIGAGPAGVGEGLALGNRGLVLDNCLEVGGLCRPIELEGAVFDLGGHSFHTPHPEIRDLVFKALEMYEQPRDARCYSHGMMISYPFQSNFRHIGNPAVVEECANDLAAAEGENGAGNFKEFVERRFASSVARHFMFPCNQKLWGMDLRLLATGWVEERVAAPEGVQEKFREDGGKRTPSSGRNHGGLSGTGRIWRNCAGLGRKIMEDICHSARDWNSD